MAALANALLYTLAGLAVFALAARLAIAAIPAHDTAGAATRAAAILGAAWVIAATLH